MFLGATIAQTLGGVSMGNRRGIFIAVAALYATASLLLFGAAWLAVRMANAVAIENALNAASVLRTHAAVVAVLAVIPLLVGFWKRRVPSLRVAFGALLLCLVGSLSSVVFTGFQSEDQWTTVTDPTGAFSVSLPNPPTRHKDVNTSTPDGSVRTSSFSAISDRHGALSLITTDSDFSGQTIDPQEAFDRVVQGKQTDGYRLISVTTITTDGHSGHELRFTDKDGYAFTQRIFYVNNHLYQFMATAKVAPMPPEQAATVKRYLASIHFLRGRKNQNYRPNGG